MTNSYKNTEEHETISQNLNKNQRKLCETNIRFKKLFKKSQK